MTQEHEEAQWNQCRSEHTQASHESLADNVVVRNRGLTEMTATHKAHGTRRYTSFYGIRTGLCILAATPRYLLNTTSRNDNGARTGERVRTTSAGLVLVARAFAVIASVSLVAIWKSPIPALRTPRMSCFV